MAHATVAIGVVIFVLVLAAMMLAVAFATLGAMAGNREIIEIAAFRRGRGQFHLAASSSVTSSGWGCAAAPSAAAPRSCSSSRPARSVGWWRATPGGEQIEALFGTFSLHLKGYAAILVIAAAIAVITGFVSRIIVFRHLRRLS